MNLLFIHPEIRKIDILNYGYLKDWNTTFLGTPYSNDKELLLGNFYSSMTSTDFFSVYDPISILGGKSRMISFGKLTLSKELINKYDAILTIEPFTFLSYSASKISSKYSLKHFIRIHTLHKSPQLFLPPFLRNANKSLSGAAGIIYATKKAESFIENQMSFNPKIKQQIYLGLDLGEYNVENIHPKYRKHNNTPEHTVINLLYVGRLVKEKGVLNLIRAVHLLNSNDIRFTLIIVGSGYLMDDIIRYEKRFQWLKYCGSMNHSQVVTVFSQSDIFVSVSDVKRTFGFVTWVEDVGHTIMEAMASGLPVVSGLCGSQPEILGDGGISVKGKPEDIAEGILYLCENLSLHKERALKRASTVFNYPKNSIALNDFLNKAYGL